MGMALRDEENRASQNSLSDENDQYLPWTKKGPVQAHCHVQKECTSDTSKKEKKRADSNRPSNRKGDDYEPSALTAGRRQTQI